MIPRHEVCRRHLGCEDGVENLHFPNQENAGRFLKILILGDSGTGKTSLRKRLVEGRFFSNVRPTMGTEVSNAIFRLGTELVHLGIWDVSGKPLFRDVRKSCYAQVDGILLVFDLSRRVTLENLEQWVLEIREEVDHAVPFVVVGTKLDLKDKTYQNFTKHDVLSFISRLTEIMGGIDPEVPFIETSSMNGYNVEKPFKNLVVRMLESSRGIPLQR